MGGVGTHLLHVTAVRTLGTAPMLPLKALLEAEYGFFQHSALGDSLPSRNRGRTTPSASTTTTTTSVVVVVITIARTRLLATRTGGSDIATARGSFS